MDYFLNKYDEKLVLTDSMGNLVSKDECKEYIKNIENYLSNFTNEEITKINKLSTNNINKIKTVEKGFLYIVQDNNLYKIGITQDIKNRVSTIYSSNPTAKLIVYFDIKDIRHTEKILHKIFKEKRIKGEWFLLNSNDIKYIYEMFGSDTIHEHI